MPKPPPPRPAKPPPRPGSIPDADGLPGKPAPPPRPKTAPREEPPPAADEDGLEFDFPSTQDAPPQRPKTAEPKAPLRPTTGEPKAERMSIPDLDLNSQAQKNLADDLAQVEAAMAALEGRDPTRGIEVAYARRNAEKVRVELKSIVDQSEIHIAKNEKRRRWVAFAGALCAVLVAAAGVKAYLVVAERAREAATLQEACKRVSSPFVDAGFDHHARSVDAPITVSGEGGRCFVAVAATKTGAATVRVERGPEKVEGASAAFCSCGDVVTTVTAVGASPVGLEIVAIDAGRVGGPDLLGSLRPKTSVTLGESDDRACAETAIDQLVAAARPDPGKADGDLGKRLGPLGFTPLGSADGDRPFLDIESSEGGCVVVASDGAGDELSLRLKGGERPLPPARTLALCEGKGTASSVWRNGRGRIEAFGIGLDRIGGSVGLVESLVRAGLGGIALHRSDEAIAAEPRASLLASGATPAHLVEGTTSLLGSPDPPFLFAFAATDGRTAPPISPANATCTPGLASSPAAAVCLGDRTLFEDKRGARASRPEWLQIGTDPPSIEAGLALMALARRLHAIGFDPTPPIGATLTATGADVTGRPNESNIVGVVVGTTAPFIQTLSNGAPWDLNGEPRIIPLAPGAKVSLVATPKASGGKRSLVLFRK